MSELKISYENLFGAKTSVMFFKSFENCTKQREESHESARNWRANHVGIGSRADYVTNNTATVNCRF